MVMQDMPKIVVNPRPINRLPFEEIDLLELHTVFKPLWKPIAPFTDHRCYVLYNALQVRKLLRCCGGEVSNTTPTSTNVVPFRAERRGS